jgi:hypothetical protein
MKNTRFKLRLCAAAVAGTAFFVSVILCPVRALDASDFTAPSEMVQSDNARGKEWAEYIVQEAGAKTDMQKIRAVYAWYVENLEYYRDVLSEKVYDEDAQSFVSIRDLPRTEHALYIPRYDYLTVLASVAEYAMGRSKIKPKNLCGGFAFGIAGSLRALGIPVQIQIGHVERAARKGEVYFDADGARKVSAGNGETPYRYWNGKWIKIKDLHARLAIRAESSGRWIYADPTFDSIDAGTSYFDMSEEDRAKRWTLLYLSSERTPRAWEDKPTPALLPPPR